MDADEIHDLGKVLFSAAIAHAEQEGETVMEGGGDEHFWQTATGPQLLRAAVAYFRSAI